ncbi:MULTISPECIES: hypothetical protein [unclassified Desulfovibrio]
MKQPWHVRTVAASLADNKFFAAFAQFSSQTKGRRALPMLPALSAF